MITAIGLVSILLSTSVSELCLPHSSKSSNQRGPCSDVTDGPSAHALPARSAASSANSAVPSAASRSTSLPSNVLLMLGNGFSQLAMVLVFILIGVLLPFLARLR